MRVLPLTSFLLCWFHFASASRSQAASPRCPFASALAAVRIAPFSIGTTPVVRSENPIRRDGLAQRDTAQEVAFNRAFGRLDARPRALVEIARATPYAWRIAAALQACGCHMLDQKEPPWKEACTVTEALAVGRCGNQRSGSGPRGTRMCEHLCRLALACIAPRQHARPAFHLR